MKRPFCNAGCKDCYKEDRRLGLIYGSFAVRVGDVPEGVQSHNCSKEGYTLVGWEDGSRINGTCAYCGADLERG